MNCVSHVPAAGQAGKRDSLDSLTINIHFSVQRSEIHCFFIEGFFLQKEPKEAVSAEMVFLQKYYLFVA